MTPSRIALVAYLMLGLVGCGHAPLATPATMGRTSPPVSAEGGRYVGFATGESQSFATVAVALHEVRPGETIFVAPGVFRERIVIGQSGVTLQGSGAPVYQEGQLVGGTLIVGSIDCGAQFRARVVDLGVQADPANVNAITSGRPGHGTRVDQSFENLSLLGGGYDARSHALLCHSGAGVSVRNIRMYRWYHGLALKCEDATVEAVYGFQCGGSTIIVKSDANTGNASRIQIRDVVVDGRPTGQQWGGSIHIQSASADYVTRDVDISDVSARYAARGAILMDRLGGLGTVAAITVTNAMSEHAGASEKTADYDVSGATDVIFDGCRSVDAKGIGFRSRDGASGVRVVGGDVVGAEVATCEGEFAQLELATGTPTQ